MFQELLIRTSSLLSLLGEEQAPPLRPAHERVLMLLVAEHGFGSPLTWPVDPRLREAGA